MGIPSIEKCPGELTSRWAAVWRLSRDEMLEAGTFSATAKVLLDEMVWALANADACRMSGEDAAWDRLAKRGSMLADQLGLSPRGRKALKLLAGGQDDEKNTDPFAQLDELAPRRKAKGA